MQNNYTTQRLSLDKLTLNDAEFILELVNTPGWLQFIGDRNIHSVADATAYIQKIIDNANISYWVVRQKEDQTATGVITFIKRDYLDYHDIGFAFLPAYAGQGYAAEAAFAVLQDAVSDPAHTYVLATTIKENTSSIKLLQKLGLRYREEVTSEGELLHVYAVHADKVQIDHLTRTFFSAFTNIARQPNLEIIQDVCIAEVLIIKKAGTTETIYNLESFIEPRRTILSDGTLANFEERETNEQTTINSNMAQRSSQYEKTGHLNGVYFHEFGNKMFQFIKTGSGWRICAVTWEDRAIVTDN